MAAKNLPCAFRYVLGRRSYIVKAIFDLIQDKLHKISSQTIKIMLRDLSTDNFFTDKCDIECCNEFKKSLEKTLQQREELIKPINTRITKREISVEDRTKDIRRNKSYISNNTYNRNIWISLSIPR